MHTNVTIWSARVGIILLLGWVSTASAQTAEDALRFSQRSPATGARMIGFAGAGLSGIGDYGALNGNPAGLGYVASSSISGTLQFIEADDQSSSGTVGFLSRGNEQSISGGGIGNFAYLYRAPSARGSLVIAAGFNQVQSFDRELRFTGTNSRSTISTSFLPFDGEYALDNGNLDTLDDLPFAAFNGGFIEFFPEFLESDADAYPFHEAVVPGTSIKQTGIVLEEGRMSEASLGGALEISQGVMLGLSANLAVGQYEYGSTFEEDDVNNENGANDYSVLQDGGGLLEGFSHLMYRQRLRSDMVGFNARLGISAELGSHLRVGIMLESPTYYFVEESYGAEYRTLFDDGGALSYGENASDVGSGIFDYEINSPWRAGAGVGIHTDNFTVLADVEIVNWSRLSLEASDEPGVFADLNRAVKEDYGTAINSRVGAELRLGDVMIRGGLALRPDPTKVALTTSTGASLEWDRLFVSAGLGYHVNQRLQIDLGVMHGRFSSGYVAYPEDAYGARQDHRLQIDEEIEQNQVVMGATYRF